MSAIQEFAGNEVRIFSLLGKAGFEPKVIFDIGAANGMWSALVHEVFPDALYHLFEPLAEALPSYRAHLQEQIANHPNFTLHPVALGAERQRVEMRVHADGYGSTILDMGPHPEYQARRMVDQYTLDGYIQDRRLRCPDILKIDTQGAERLILSQAKATLKNVSVLFLETWLVRGYGPATPLLPELICMLDGHDFLLAELGERFYDDRHNLYGVDAFFLKRSFLKAVAHSLPKGMW